jgi:hypothetical protein
MAAPANRIAGTCFVKVGGRQLSIAGTITVSPAKVEREGKAGLSGVAGYVEKSRVPYIEVECNALPAVRLADLEAVVNETVTAELGNGRTYILRNAWLAPAIEEAAAEGTFTARFEGMDCQEI